MLGGLRDTELMLERLRNTDELSPKIVRWSYPALVDRVALSTQSPFAISLS